MNRQEEAVHGLDPIWYFAAFTAGAVLTAALALWLGWFGL